MSPFAYKNGRLPCTRKYGNAIAISEMMEDAVMELTDTLTTPGAGTGEREQNEELN